jgi:hypothetical protein
MDFGFELLSETKSQQPSGVETVLNGWPGSWTKETGSAIAALHCARAAAERHSASSAARVRADVLELLMPLKK